MWFDVGIKRYTTDPVFVHAAEKLWFDVGIKRYTTGTLAIYDEQKLWFDVGIKRYTTYLHILLPFSSCGLM